MKNLVLTGLILIFCLSLSAQEINLWQNFRHSAVTPSSLIHLNWETISNPLDTLEILMKKNNQIISMNPQNTLLAYNASIQTPDADAPSIAIRSMMENYGILTPLKIGASTPVNSSIMIKACEDSLNEAVTNGDNKLDIKSFHFAYNDNEIMAGIVNQNGSYPGSVTIIGPYYVYGVGFLNPENIMDSTAYALINANVMGLITPGLYKMHGSDFTDFQNFDFSAIQRVGDISSTTSDNMLIMKCNWDVITQDEDFGSWPTISKSMVFVPFIMKLVISDLQNINGDIGSPALINFTDLSLNLSNTQPVLSNPIVSHVNNTAVINIRYTDPDGNYPLISYFKIGETEYPMLPQSLNFDNSVNYSTIIPNLDWSTGSCYFSDDSTNVVNFEIPNQVGNDYIPEISSTNLQVYPNPFRSNQGGLNIKSDSRLGKIEIFNIKGQLIKTVKTERCEYSWNGTDEKGCRVSNGIYLIKAHSGQKSSMKRLIIIK